MRMNGKFTESVEEYSKALEIRSRISSSTDRILSNIHFLLAVAHIYKSSEKEVSDPIAEKQQALTHYIQSRKVLEERLKLPKSQTTTEEEENKANGEIKELIDELTETIDALRTEIKEVSHNYPTTGLHCNILIFPFTF
jgi:chromosome segregation ATPase